MAKDIVSEMIDDWMSARPSRNVAILSRSSGVGESTLRRILSGTGKPSLDVILSIGRVTGQRDKMLAAVEAHYPTCAKVIAEVRMSAGPQPEADMTEFFETNLSTTLFVSLHTRTGIPADNVETVYGRKGQEVVSRLVELGIARREGERYVPINEWFSYRSPDEVLRVIRNLSLDFDKAQLGTEFGRICMLSESVSPTAAREIQSIMDSAIIDIRKVLDDGSSEGDNVVSISMLMQRLI